MTAHQLTRVDARRIAVRAQLLDSARPTGLVDLVRHLTLLQLDPTAAIAPNAHLAAWSRLGASYRPADLDAALADRALVEVLALVRPMKTWCCTGRSPVRSKAWPAGWDCQPGLPPGRP